MGVKRALILLSLLLLAATSINTTTVTSNSTLSLAGEQYVVSATLTDAINLQTPDGGRILELDECVYRDVPTYFCLSESDNDSASVEYLRKDKSVELVREMPSSVMVGDEALVTLTLENTGELALALALNESTNVSYKPQRGLDTNLSWNGTLDAGDSEEFSYYVQAHRAGEYGFFANLTGALNASDQASLVVDDFVDVSAQYTQSLTRDQRYNFSLEMSSSQDNVSADVALRVPAGLRVEDSEGLVGSNATYAADFLLNQTRTLAITYLAQAAPAGPLRFSLTTTRNQTSVTRNYTYALNKSVFEPLRIRTNLDNRTLYINESVSGVAQLSNPNSDAVQAQVHITSILVDREQTVTVPPNASANVSFSVLANRSNDYGVRVSAQYTDRNDESLSSTHFVNLPARERPVVTPDPSVSISGPAVLSSNGSASLRLTVRNAPSDAGFLVWTRNGQQVRSAQVAVASNQTYQLPISAPGTYAARLNVSNHSLSARYVVTARAPTRNASNTTTSAPASTTSDDSWLLFVLVLAVALVGGVLVWRVRATRIQHDLQERLALLERFEPQTPEQVRMRDQLVLALERELEQNS